MRLDKFLAKMTILSRSEVAKAARKGRILINGKAVKSPKAPVNENKDTPTKLSMDTAGIKDRIVNRSICS